MKESEVDILKNGLKWEFTEKPRLRTKPWKAQCWMSRKKREACDSKTVRKRCHRRGNKTRFNWILLHSVPQKENIWRDETNNRPKTTQQDHSEQNILDGICQNHSSAMEPNQWSISIDLMDAYFHQNFRKYLRFAVLDRVNKFTALPFGHVIAPRIFTEVMKEIAIIPWKSGITIHMYLDNWIIREDNQEVLKIHSVNILELCNLLGLLVSIPKSELTPAQILEYVGILFDLAAGRAYPPRKIYNIVS